MKETYPEDENVTQSERHGELKRAVITVGDGRGFVVNGRAYFADSPHDRLIITAAHCLPFFPPCHGASYGEERTYKALLAPLGSQPAVWAECLFADPIADIAILGSPDGQNLSEEAEAYEALVETAIPLSIADAPEDGQGWLLSLDQKWFRCSVRYMKYVDGPLWISGTSQPVVDGMSGSPIISDDGAAIGVVSLGSISFEGAATEDVTWLNLNGCPNPRLVRDLPGWLLNAQKIGEPA